LAQRADKVAALFAAADIPMAPAPEDAANTANGVQIKASKRWAYLQALEAVEDMAAKAGRPLRIADLAGGRGVLAPYLATQGHQVELFDVDNLSDDGDPDAEWRFRRWAEERGLAVRYGSHFNVPAHGGDYDLVISTTVVGATRYKEFAVKEALRLLRPRGKLLVAFELAEDDTPAPLENNVEQATPTRLRAAFARVDGAGDLFPFGAIAASTQDVKQDGVAGIPAGVTVGCCTVVRSN
jgi:SAM-dependent methyltransferase